MKPLYSSKNPFAWLLKVALVGILGGILLHSSSVQNATINDFVVSFASIPAIFILAAEAIDKISDRFDYTKISARIVFGKADANARGSMTAIIVGLILASLAFFGVLYLAAGMITLNMSSYSPGALLSAAIIALYIIAPETGDDELLLMLWLATQFATSFSNFTVLGSLASLL